MDWSKKGGSPSNPKDPPPNQPPMGPQRPAQPHKQIPPPSRPGKGS